MATFKAVILKSTNDLKNDGTTNIKIRITHNRQINYIPTDLFVLPAHMDIKSGTAKSGPNSDFINFRIGGIIQKYRKSAIELGDRVESMTVSQIKTHLLSGVSKTHQIDFLQFINNFINIYSTTALSSGTKNNYYFLGESLKSFSGETLQVSEINYQYLIRYEAYLRSRGVKNGVTNYMIVFRSLFNKCRNHFNDDDVGKILIPHYPFRKYVIPKPHVKSKDHILTLIELQKLISFVPDINSEQFAIDMFLLMFYLIGIEAKDLFYLKKPINGRVSYTRFKTGRELSVKLEPEAIEIINRYPGEKLLLNVSERFALHKNFFRAVNNHLSGENSHKIEGVFPKLKIAKHPTTKWARHSWATIARNECKISKDDVALCLGHEDSDNKVTDMYIKYDYSIIDESNRKVLDIIKLNCSSVDVPLYDI
jgi:integrase